MTTLTITQDNFWEVLNKLYWIVSLKWESIKLNYETIKSHQEIEKTEFSELSIEDEKKIKNIPEFNTLLKTFSWM
jgi:hypothetical protein